MKIGKKSRDKDHSIMINSLGRLLILFRVIPKSFSSPFSKWYINP